MEHLPYHLSPLLREHDVQIQDQSTVSLGYSRGYSSPALEYGTGNGNDLFNCLHPDKERSMQTWIGDWASATYAPDYVAALNLSRQ